MGEVASVPSPFPAHQLHLPMCFICVTPSNFHSTKSLTSFPSSLSGEGEKHVSIISVHDTIILTLEQKAGYSLYFHTSFWSQRIPIKGKSELQTEMNRIIGHHHLRPFLHKY